MPHFEEAGAFTIPLLHLPSSLDLDGDIIRHYFGLAVGEDSCLGEEGHITLRGW